ncbi:hypothetical protein ACH5RR_008931 [Cinchona calisaya]|uniref:Uncharacterized protein n=1 Tax=Cinchona calisaya TaxID=153742 RepID=A0ABD3AEJ2_9GENT
MGEVTPKKRFGYKAAPGEIIVVTDRLTCEHLGRACSLPRFHEFIKGENAADVVLTVAAHLDDMLAQAKAAKLAAEKRAEEADKRKNDAANGQLRAVALLCQELLAEVKETQKKLDSFNLAEDKMMQFYLDLDVTQINLTKLRLRERCHPVDGASSTNQLGKQPDGSAPVE